MLLALAENEIDEDLQERGHDQAGYGERDPGDHAERERRRRVDHGKPRREPADEARPASARLEVRTGRQLQHDAGEGVLELVPGDSTRSGRGIVQPDAALRRSLDDDEV